MDEVFFLMYHMRQSRDATLSLPIVERKWLIRRLLQQKEKEEKWLEAQNKKTQH